MMQVQQKPTWEPRNRPGLDAPLSALRFVLFPLVVCVSALWAFPSLMIGLLLWVWQARAYDKRELGRGLVAVSVFGVIIYGLWVWFADPLPWLWQGITFDVARRLFQPLEYLVGLLWAFNLWLAPLCGLALAHLSPFRRLPHRSAVHLKSVDQGTYEREETALISSAMAQFEGMVASQPSAAMLERAASSASVVAPSAGAVMIPGSQSAYESLGAYLGGELDQWVFSNNLCIPPGLLELHGLLVGEPKMGKTWTLLRLAAIARAYGRKIIYLDMKGSRRTAALFLAAMSLLKVSQFKMYPLEAYDGWRGTPKALYNRLMEQIDPRTHPFYRAGVGSSIVSLVVNAPGGPPRNSYEFLERIHYDWLKAAYANDAQAQREIQAVIPHIDGLQLVFAGFFRGIAGGLDGTWAFDDSQACYIGIDSIANKEEAALMGRYLLEDAADYATTRKPPDEKVLLIIDEFGGLRSTNATDLYEKIREAGMSVYASSQSYQALGPERDHVLGASFVKILHRTGDPRRIVEYAGEREKYTYSRMMGGSGDDEDMFHPLANRVRDGEDQGHRTIMRPEKELAVPIEEVQQLEPGQIALISGGKGGFAQVHPLAIPDQLIRAAASFIRAAPKFTPLPPPTVPPAKPVQGHKKKIAAAPQQKKPGQPNQQRASGPGAKGPGTKQKTAAAPVSSAPSQQPANSGKRPFPQNTSGQGMPQQQPATAQGATPTPKPAATPAPSPSPQKPPTGGLGQGGQHKKTGGQDDDDVIDFYS
jgi:hypothetical protein